MDEAAKKLLCTLEAQCSKREYCSYDIRAKIRSKLGDDSGNSDEILDSLIADRYVDDLRYASAFAREKASLTGWGPIKIRFALSAKRIPDPLITEALAGIDSDRAGDKLEKLLEAKWKTLADDPQGRLKLIKFGLGRGYAYEEVGKLVRRITGRQASDDI